MVDDEGFFESLLNRGSSGDGFRWRSAALDQLTASEFEMVVGALFTGEGYDVERSGPTGERCIDLIGRKSGLLRSKTIVIAVTSPGGTISPGTIQQVERARTMNGAASAVVVRPKPFNDPIHDAVSGNSVELLAGRELIDRLIAAGIQYP